MTEPLNDPPPDVTPPPAVDQDARTWGMLCHLLAIFMGWLGPLIIWLIKKDQIPFVDDQGKEALNFQISIFIYAVASGFLMIVLIGFLLMPAVIIFSVVMTIIAAVKANSGERYRYPLCIRFLK